MSAEILHHHSPETSATGGGKRTKSVRRRLPPNMAGKGSRKRKLVEKKVDLSDSEEEEEKQRQTGEEAAAKRRRKRARRGQRRPHKGYYEMTDRERALMEERAKARADQIRARMLAKGHMLAPYNSTQFIISDREQDEVRRLDNALHDQNRAKMADLFKTSPQRVSRRQRNDSSFSMDSDEGYFYSSPEDEQEFISKEFRKDYAKGHMDRLDKMDKMKLIQEYLSVEKKMELLEKRLEDINHQEAVKAWNGEVDYEFARGEVPMEPDMAEKIKVFQAEIARLIQDNAHLLRENSSLKRKLVRSTHHPSDSSSAASSSSSSSSSSEEDSSSPSEEDSSSDEETTRVDELLEDRPQCKEGADKTDDTGYESTQSKEQTPEPERRRSRELSPAPQGVEPTS